MYTMDKQNYLKYLAEYYSNSFKSKFNLSLKRFAILLIVYSIMSVGCIWQLVSICQLYFEYPTIVSIETKFENSNLELPAITFCTENLNRGIDIRESFKRTNIKDILKRSEIETETHEVIHEESIETVIEIINSDYYCFTLNSLMKGENFFHAFSKILRQRFVM
jgi:hypothetical protein